VDDQRELDAEPAEHKYLVAARCENRGGDVTKEYGFVDADTATAAATIARRIWSTDDKTPVDEIYVADFTDSFDLSTVDVADESE